jgi:type IV secretory pathway VirD2 relaxase
MHLRYTSKPYTDKKRQWKKGRDDTLEDSGYYHEQDFEDEDADDDFS